MERKRGLTLHWGVLLIVYMAIVFATTMVVLTTGAASLYYFLLLVAGVPVYAIATRTLMREDDGAQVSDSEAALDARLVTFPEQRSSPVATDIARGAVETRAHDFRKVG